MLKILKYFTRKRIVVLLLISLSVSFMIVDSRFLFTGYSPIGGVWFTSSIFNASESGNESYSVQFLNVNFTFLYLTYPDENVEDVPYTIFVNVSFQDGMSEILSIPVDGYTSVSLISIPYGQRTTHSSPAAAVLSSNTLGYWGWQYAVSSII